MNRQTPEQDFAPPVSNIRFEKFEADMQGKAD